MAETSEEPTDQPHRPASEGAWKIHDVNDSWIGRVDVKASIVLAVESAVLGLLIGLSTGAQKLASLRGARHWCDSAALGLLALSSLLSLIAVCPQLGRGGSRSNEEDRLVFFGHVRKWEHEKLAAEFDQGRPNNLDVARQIVSLAKVSWRKHVLLQWSIGVFVLGVIVLAGLLV